MTKDEVLWGNIRFLLLLIFSVAAIYIILCRYITQRTDRGQFGADKRHQPFRAHF